VVKRVSVAIILSALRCSALALTLSADDEAAHEAATQWLQIVDAGKYADAAQMMSQEIRSQKDWPAYFVRQRAPFGRTSGRHVLEVKHESTIPDAVGVRKYAVLRFKTSFERGATTTEQVVMAKMGCCWEVFDYEIK